MKILKIMTLIMAVACLALLILASRLRAETSAIAAAGFAPLDRVTYYGTTGQPITISWDYNQPAPGAFGLAEKFKQTALTDGMQCYSDRDHTITLPSKYAGRIAFVLPNDERNFTTADGYLVFTIPDVEEVNQDVTVYVAYDSRATHLPNWMDGFEDTGDEILTTLDTQPALKIYSNVYQKGQTINFGANKAEGFQGNVVSNYLVFVNLAALVYRVKLLSVERNEDLEITPAEGITSNSFTVNLPKSGHYIAKIAACISPLTEAPNCSDWSESINPEVATVDGVARAWWLYGHVAPVGVITIDPNPY